MSEVRQPAYSRYWSNQRVLPGITPKKLDRVLRNADIGLLDEYLGACAELEERDGQYGSQMRVRRAAVTGLEWGVSTPTGAGARASAGVQRLVDSGRMFELRHHALDALGKGYAITQIVWEDERGTWQPRFVTHDQREFQRDDDDLEWRLRDGSTQGAELLPAKWVIHEPLLRAGPSYRRGLARPAMYLHMAKWLSLAGWVTLMKLFGVPLAIAKYDQPITPQDRKVIRAALAGLGNGISAIIPKNAEVEIIQAAKPGATPEHMFSSLLEYVDRQISKLVLGQTMTADDGSSQAQATVHNDVRKDIREDDSEQLARTLNRDVIRPFVELNFGPQRVYPRVFIQQEDTRDLVQVVAAAVALMPYGFKVKIDEVYPLFGFTKPADNDEVLAAAPGPSARPDGPDSAGTELDPNAAAELIRRAGGKDAIAAHLRALGHEQLAEQLLAAA